MSPAGERPFALVPRRRFVGVRFGQHRSPRRGQGDEVAGTRPVPAGRPPDVDRLARVGAPLGRPGHRRVRRPRVLRRHGAAGRARRRPAAADGALRAAAALARQAGGHRRRRCASIGRAAAAAGGELAYVDQRRSRPRWLSPGPPLTVLERVGAHDEADRGAAGPAVARRLPPRARPARVELSRRNVRFRRLRFHRRRLPEHLAQAARAPLGRHARRGPGPDVGAVVPGCRRRPAARPRCDVRRGR